MAFIVENGSYPNKYRTYDPTHCVYTWTESIDDAIHYARRKDAELLHMEDEDACFIREIDAQGALMPKGPYAVMKNKYLVRGTNIIEAMVDLGPLAQNDDDLLTIAAVCAAALNSVHLPIEQMRREHDKLIARIIESMVSVTVTGAPVEITLTPPAKPTGDELLHLFQEFCVSNATQWKMGAGDHHHPIWEMVADICGRRPPITEGPEWAFIQPMNRKSLEDLKKKVDHEENKIG